MSYIRHVYVIIWEESCLKFSPLFPRSSSFTQTLHEWEFSFGRMPLPRNVSLGFLVLLCLVLMTPDKSTVTWHIPYLFHFSGEPVLIHLLLSMHNCYVYIFQCMMQALSSGAFYKLQTVPCEYLLSESMKIWWHFPHNLKYSLFYWSLLMVKGPEGQLSFSKSTQSHLYVNLKFRPQLYFE